MKILCEGENILYEVPDSYVPGSGQNAYDAASFGWWFNDDGVDVNSSSLDPTFTGNRYKYRPDELKNVSGVCTLKTLDERKTDRLKYWQGVVLSRFTLFNNAIATQMATNEAIVDAGGTAIYTIPLADIKTVGEYQNLVATFHVPVAAGGTWIPGDYTLNSNGDLYLTSDPAKINEDMFNGNPAIHETVSRYMD